MKKNLIKEINWKVGDYFKGRVENYYITGRISRNEDGGFVGVFNNFCVDEGIYAEDYYGFDHTACLDNIEDIQKITPLRHEILLTKYIYSNFMNYVVAVKKTPKDKSKDLFTFGCGAVSVTRAQAEGIVKYLSLLEDPKFRETRRLIASIEAESERTLDDYYIPEIKELLNEI